jgi:hypothetical protein
MTGGTLAALTGTIHTALNNLESRIASRTNRAEKLVVAGVSTDSTTNDTTDYDGQPHQPSHQPNIITKHGREYAFADEIAMRRQGGCYGIEECGL